MFEIFRTLFLSLSTYFVCEHPYIDPYDCTWRKKRVFRSSIFGCISCGNFFFQFFSSIHYEGIVEWDGNKKFFSFPCALVIHSYFYWFQFFLSLGFVYASHVITYAYRISISIPCTSCAWKNSETTCFVLLFLFSINLACDKIRYNVVAVDVKGVH